MTTLGRPAKVPGYHDTSEYPEAEHLPGLVIFRFDAPIIFANSRTFRDRVRELASKEPRPKWILIAAEPVTDIDSSADEMLSELDKELNAHGTSLVFAELKDQVRRRIRRYGLVDEINPEHYFPTLEAAVEAFQHQHGGKWQRSS